MSVIIVATSQAQLAGAQAKRIILLTSFQYLIHHYY